MSDARDRHPDDRLSAYLDDEVEAAERTEIDRHLASCARCRGELASLRRLSRSLAEESVPPVPPDMTQRVASALDAAAVVRLPRRTFMVPLTIAATVAAVGLLVIVRWQGSRAPALPPMPRAEREHEDRRAQASDASSLPEPKPPVTKSEAHAAAAPPSRRVSERGELVEPLQKNARADAVARDEVLKASVPAPAAALPETPRASAKEIAPQSAAEMTADRLGAAAGLSRAKVAPDSCGERWADAGSLATWDVEDPAAAILDLDALARGVGGRSEPPEAQADGSRSVVVPPSGWDAFARDAAARGIVGLAPAPDRSSTACIRQRIEIRPLRGGPS